MSTATNLTTTRPFLLALSGTHPGTPGLPNEPVTNRPHTLPISPLAQALTARCCSRHVEGDRKDVRRRDRVGARHHHQHYRCGATCRVG